jgi:hypothetical protein
MDTDWKLKKDRKLNNNKMINLERLVIHLDKRMIK